MTEIVTYEEAFQQIEELLEFWREWIAEMLLPAIEQVVDAICKFIEELQRAQFMSRLHWIPYPMAKWIVHHWPRQWLPELRFEDE